MFRRHRIQGESLCLVLVYPLTAMVKTAQSIRRKRIVLLHRLGIPASGLSVILLRTIAEGMHLSDTVLNIPLLFRLHETGQRQLEPLLRFICVFLAADSIQLHFAHIVNC